MRSGSSGNKAEIRQSMKSLTAVALSSPLCSVPITVLVARLTAIATNSNRRFAPQQNLLTGFKRQILITRGHSRTLRGLRTERRTGQQTLSIYNGEQQQGGSGLSARRPVQEVRYTDGRLGCLPAPSDPCIGPVSAIAQNNGFSALAFSRVPRLVW